RPYLIGQPWSRTEGKPAVRNLRGERGNVGIIRSPIRAPLLPDRRWVTASGDPVGEEQSSSLPRPLDGATLVFAERKLMECEPRKLDHSGLAPENLTTLAHFAVSFARKASKSAGEPANISLPRSTRRGFIRGSESIALISLLSFSTIGVGVLLRKPMAHH